MQTFLKHLYRIICAIAGVGLVALAFDEGFSWYTAVGVCLVLIVIVDIIFKTSISKFFGIILLLPLIFVVWLIQGILGIFKRKKGKSKPYTFEEMFFYDEIFGSKS